MSAAADSTRAAADFLRRTDRDRYYATLVLRADVRPYVQALYAFNADVASVRDRAREPAAGEIRLQWWLDAIRGRGHGDVRRSPLADALLGAVEDFSLPTLALERLLVARRFDLYHDPMPDVPTFEGYAGETASTLYQLAAMILDGGREVSGGDAAGHLGVAHALIGHLRAFGLNASQGRLFLPYDVFRVHGVGEEEIFSGTISDGLLAARAQFTLMARGHLEQARAAIRVLRPALRPAFAMIALLSSQLEGIERHGKAPFAPPSEIADWRKIARLAWWTWRSG